MDRILSFFEEHFKGRHERKIVTGLISAGLLILVTGISINNWSMVIVLLSNILFKTEFDIPEETMNYTRLFIALSIGIILIFLGLWFYFKTRESVEKNIFIRILHSSLESVTFSKKDRIFSIYEVEDYTLNQMEEMKDLNNNNIEHALLEQQKFVQSILSRVDGEYDIKIGYFGLAHIPLVFLLGYQLSNKLNIVYYEWDQNNLFWEEIKNKNAIYPQLALEIDEKMQETKHVKEVAVKIGITSLISDNDLEGFDIDRLNSYYLHFEGMDKTDRNVITSSNQLNYYQMEFRKLLDNINHKFPKLESIHIFYSGQPSLAFRLGSVISSRMDPEIIVYNYHKTDFPRYKWAINLRKVGQPIKVQILGRETNTNV